MAFVQSLPPDYDSPTEPEDDIGPATMSGRVWEAWLDMQASTRRLVSENPSEGRLLFYLILSDLVFFLSWTIKGVLAPTSAAAAVMPIQMGGIQMGILESYGDPIGARGGPMRSDGVVASRSATTSRAYLDSYGLYRYVCGP